MKKENASLISVIIPVYNAGLYLNSCIKSIVSQTLKNVEIVLIDDGSSDDSYDIMMDWSKKDSRIKIYHQKNNGVTSARRNGVELASGKWVTFVDADDVLPRDALAQMFSYTKDADLVVGQVEYVGPRKWNFVVRDEWLEQIKYIKKMYHGVIHSVPFARLINRSILLDPYVFDIPKEITHGEDSIMNYRIATKCNKIRTIPAVVYKYFFREGSASHQNKFASLSYCRKYEESEWSSFPDEMKKKLYFERLWAMLYRRKKILQMNVNLYSKKWFDLKFQLKK